MAVPKHKKKQALFEVFLEVADNSGKPLLIMPQEQVLRQKLRHKGVIICLRNLHGRIFLCRRRQAASIPHNGLWNLAASGNVLAGESFYDAALRCLEEQLNITGLDLFEVARLEPSPQTGNAEAALFLTAKSSVLPRMSEYGHQHGMFVDQEELQALLRDFPHLVAPFLHLTLPHVF